MSFCDYDEKLGESTDDEIWFDSDVFDATELLTRFSESDWELLNTALPHKDRAWRTRCVATLSAGDVIHGVGILIDLIYQGDVAMAVSACDSLRCILQREKVVLPISASLNERIAKVFSLASDKEMYRQWLLKHVSVSAE